MNNSADKRKNLIFIFGGLGVALLVAVFLSPLASKHPDGLDRVAQDLKFDSKEAVNKPAEKLPFFTVFDGYSLRGVPEQIATPLAGLVGTLATFGLAWGIGKLTVKHSSTSEDNSASE
jgi:cobalt/nickel transport protein